MEEVASSALQKSIVLRKLSRSWAHALTHSFSPNARILSTSIVLFRRVSRKRAPCNNSKEELALWIYSCSHHKIWSLPVPPIPPHLEEHVKLVCDDNEECIYSFTFVFEKGVYDVDVLDLRNCSRWKRLPSLPLCNDDSCEYQAYRCSSSSSEDCSCITYTIYMRKMVESLIEEDPYAFSQWTFNDSDSEEGKWQCKCFSSRPFIFADAEEKKPPMYVEIDREGGPLIDPCHKILYQRCERLDDNEAPYHGWGAGYLLMFQENTVNDQPTIYSFYQIRTLSIDYNLDLDKMSCTYRIVEDEPEGASFWKFWQRWIDHSSNLLEERSAIKVLEKFRDTAVGVTETVPTGINKGGNCNSMNVQVAQRSHLYLYRRISFW